MSEKENGPFDSLFLDEIRKIVREEVSATKLNESTEKDHWLTGQEAAAILGGDPKEQIAWLHRHARKLSFAKRISRKKLRFNEAGLRRWISRR
jgi:hypothetical protein